LTDPAKIKRALKEVRKSGIACAREENIAGITGICAPVFDRSGVPVAAVGIAAPSVSLEPSQMPAIENAIRRGAAQLSEQLGWRATVPVAA
jgi:DNA-binding IclR family transcriptional regulator